RTDEDGWVHSAPVATILLVCTGNICRTPMARALLAERFRLRGVDRVDIVSAGTVGWQGSPATPEAQAAVAELGLDASAHSARRLTPRSSRAPTSSWAWPPSTATPSCRWRRTRSS